MGYSLSWYAVRGKSAQQVCDDLGVEATGEREEFPDSPLVGAKLPGNWYVVVANHSAIFGRPPDEKRLSSGCEMIACFVEEHVMCSYVQGWQNGKQVWSVLHDPSDGISHLLMEGTAPPTFNAIRDRLAAEQQAAGGDDAKVDHIFEVPIELAKTLTGFRHDEDVLGSGVDPFEVLEVKTEIATRTGFRVRRSVAWTLRKLVIAALLAILLFGVGMFLLGVVAIIITIVRRIW